MRKTTIWARNPEDTDEKPEMYLILRADETGLVYAGPVREHGKRSVLRVLEGLPGRLVRIRFSLWRAGLLPDDVADRILVTMFFSPRRKELIPLVGGTVAVSADDLQAMKAQFSAIGLKTTRQGVDKAGEYLWRTFEDPESSVIYELFRLAAIIERIDDQHVERFIERRIQRMKEYSLHLRLDKQ